MFKQVISRDPDQCLSTPEGQSPKKPSEESQIMSKLQLAQSRGEGIELMEEPQMPLTTNQYSETQKLSQYRVNMSLMVRPGSPRASPSAINIKQIESEEKADRSRLTDMLIQRHPKKRNGNQLEDYTLQDVCCETATGRHYLCGTSKALTEVDQFGIGISMYFRFVKQLACFYFLFFILSIPSILFSLLGSNQYDNRTAFDNLLDFFASSTVGSLGLDTTTCSVDQFDKEKGTIYQYYSCSTGILDFDKTFTVGIVNLEGSQSQNNCDYLTANQIDYSCKYETPLKFNKTCDQQSNCSFYMKNTSFQSNCSYDLQDSYIYTNVYCKNTYLKFLQQNLSSNSIPQILAACDAAIIVLFIVMLLSLRAGEQDYTNRIKFEEPEIQDFTIQFSNLPHKNLSEDQLKVIVWNHIQNYSESYIKKHQIAGQENFLVFDLKVSASQEQLLLQKEIRTKELHLAKRIRNFLKINKIDVLDEQEISVKHLRLLEPKIELEYKKQAQILLNKIEKSFLHINKEKDRLIYIQNKPMENIKYVWATFLTQEQAAIAHQAFQTLPSERFILCCYPSCLDVDQKELLINNKFLTTKPASNPENINWENIRYSNFSRYMRQAITLILTLSILAASFFAILYINRSKDQTIQKYPAFSCSDPLYNNITDAKLRQNSDDNGFVQCYCSLQVNQILAGQLPSDIEHICGLWFKDQTFLKLIPIAAVLCITLINMIIEKIFQGLSDFEKHQSLSNEYTSRVQKIFVAQFFNTAIILLITNSLYYDDMSPQWYLNVGTVVLLTILINIITIPVSMIVEQILKVFQRFWDRSCTNNRSKTKQKTMKELVELYSGPQFLIDLRYAQILNVSFVCMMYGAGMPLLYFLTTITLIVLYWLDKIWLFMYYRIPTNFDDKITKTARSALRVVVLVHCGFAIYIYGNQHIFYEPNQDLLDGYDEDQRDILTSWKRINFKYNIVLVVLFVLIVTFFVFRYLFVGPFSKLLSGCKKFIFKSVEHPNFTKPLTHFLTDQQLEKEVKLLQYQIDISTNKPYQTLLKGKQQYLLDFLNTPLKPHSMNLQGRQSYDIAYQERYEDCIDWHLIHQIVIKEDQSPKEDFMEHIYKGIVEQDVIVEI